MNAGSVLSFALAFLGMVLGLVLLVALASLLSVEGRQLGLESEGYSSDELFQIWTLGLDFLSIVPLLIVTGILGQRAAFRPDKAKSFVVLSAITAAFNFAALCLQLSIDLTYLFTAVILLGVPAFCLWAGCRLQKQAREYAEQGRAFISPEGNFRYLGFLRVLMTGFTVNIVYCLVSLVATSRNAVAYTPSNLIDWANIVFEALALYFIVRRFKVVRPYVIGYALFNIIAGTVVDLLTGNFGFVEQLLYSGFDIALIIYFAVSKQVRSLCDRPFSLGRAAADEQDVLGAGWHGWPFLSKGEDGKLVRDNAELWAWIRRLLVYYCVFSLAGHWMEAGFCQLIRLGVVSGDYDPGNTMLWRDWFYPFPMEGFAVVVIGLALYPLKEYLVDRMDNHWLPYAISFFANMLLCVAIEFSMGLIVNADHQLWDYSDMFGNIMGQVCLQNALGFGVAASVIAWFVYPMLESLLRRVPNEVMKVVFVLTIAAYAIPQTLYLIDPPDDADVEAISYDQDAASTSTAASG